MCVREEKRNTWVINYIYVCVREEKRNNWLYLQYFLEHTSSKDLAAGFMRFIYSMCACNSWSIQFFQKKKKEEYVVKIALDTLLVIFGCDTEIGI